MAWRVAKALDVLLAQINELAPGRSEVSDGSIGDAAHQTRTSDHNPWVPPPDGGVVTARDFTHDPGAGADMHKLSEALRLSEDRRIKYVIFNGRMFSGYATSGYAPWTWRPYSGINAHAAHMHISVQPTNYDLTDAWDLSGGKDWFAMATKKELEEIVRRVVQEENDKQRKLLAVGKTQKAYDPDKVNIRAVLEK